LNAIEHINDRLRSVSHNRGTVMQENERKFRRLVVCFFDNYTVNDFCLNVVEGVIINTISNIIVVLVV
jgi:hypothetical protein